MTGSICGSKHSLMLPSSHAVVSRTSCKLFQGGPEPEISFFILLEITRYVSYCLSILSGRVWFQFLVVFLIKKYTPNPLICKGQRFNKLYYLATMLRKVWQMCCVFWCYIQDLYTSLIVSLYVLDIQEFNLKTNLLDNLLVRYWYVHLF